MLFVYAFNSKDFISSKVYFAITFFPFTAFIGDTSFLFDTRIVRNINLETEQIVCAKSNPISAASFVD